MARKPAIDMSAWPSLSLEGNLIAPAMVAAIDRRAAGEQKEPDYRIRKGLTVREEISTAFRVGQSHYDAFAKVKNPSAEATRRFMRAFLEETFGFDDLAPADGALSFIAGERIPVVVVPPTDEKLDRRSATLSTDRARSPAFALQDYLNEYDGALWGLVTNGTLVRLVRDNASLTRPAYIEADVAQIFTNEDAASFAVLWLLIHRSRFGVAGAPATDCALERWRDAGSREGEVARDRLAVQVQIALKVLGSGFLEANPDLAAKLKSGEVDLTEWFNELLRLVYRLIFLMVAEDRNLLHPEKAKPEPRKLYAEGYSLAALRAQCFRAATWDKHYDRYEGIKIVFRALARGQERLALPALGGIFSDDKLPHLETARLRNRAFMDALYRLSWLSDKTGMVTVNWRAMETEELGSVYESLLELQPQLGDDGKSLVFASEVVEQKGNQRKTTGSYYTPDSLVQALLDTALDPVLDRVEAGAADPAKALLKLSVIDPACGSGHFLLAAARRIATRLARIRAEGTPALSDFRHALRDVARFCLHGVDRNPMAVELTKVALWIETVDPGLPLGFFDAQIRCGDALLGVFDLKVLQDGIPDAAFKPLTGDDKDTAKYYLQTNRATKAGQGGFDFGTGQVAMPEMKPLALDFSSFRDLPEDTVEQIGAKAARFRELRKGQAFARATTAAELYVAAFLLPKVGVAPAGPSARTVPTTEEVWLALGQGKTRQAMTDATKTACRAHAFHWPLEFPDIMQRGGFDVVLGNPPWEVMQLSDKEYFAARKPEIAALTGANRKKAIEGLRRSEPILFDNYEVMKRISGAANEFARASGRFELTAKGKVNTFALFAELSLNLIAAKGRSGSILPAEILTSETLADFFQHLIKNGILESAFAFENEEFVFPGIANVVRFCLITLSKIEKKKQSTRMAHYLRQVSHLSDDERIVDIPESDFSVFSPNVGTSPVLRSKFDFWLAKKLFKTIPALSLDGERQIDSWLVEAKQGLFNMTSDSSLFQEKSDLQREGYTLSVGMKFLGLSSEHLPLYEGKFISHFDHRFSSYHNLGKEKGRGGRGLPPVRMEEYQNPDFEVLPRYWVDARLVDEKVADFTWSRQWLVGWRDITSAKLERTVAFAFMPKSGVGDTCSLLFLNHQTNLIACLLANLNSLVLDYCARQIVGGTHMTVGYLKQLPVLSPSYYNETRLAFIVPKVLELSYTSHALASFARDLGHAGPPFAWDEDGRADLRAELDAFYARAYGLTRDELRYILDPADVKGADYPSETFRVLKEKEIRQFGEYRTRRLVLEAWARMEEDGTFANLGLGAGQVADTAPTIQEPAVAALPDGAWARATQQPQDAGAALTAILKAVDGPTPSRTIRLAAAMMLNPHLLTSQLPGAQSREWRRLIGREAEPRTGNMVGFAARTNQGWGAAVSSHRGNGRLIENISAGTWAPGPGLGAFDTAGWPDSRAGFVLEALSALDLDTTVISMPDEVRGWITHAATA